MTCGAVALWVSAGALTLADSYARAAYVGILPPLSLLVLLLAGALLFTFVVRPAPRRVAPLWLSAIVLVPWLPIPLPLSAFMWTGPVKWWLWIAIAVALVAPHLGGNRWVQWTVASPRRAALAAALLAALAYGLGAWAVAPRRPGGDEPHYLVIAQSLLQDGDLQIENNHIQGDYRAYFERSLAPHYLQRGKNGAIYSVHSPGLSLFVAPVFALFGYVGVVAALVLISAAASAVAWLVAWRATGDPAATWFAWAAVSMSVPLFFHAPAIYPDTVAASVALFGILPLVHERAREPRWLVVVGAGLALLPWLHARFAILAAAIGVALAARLIASRAQRVSRLAALFSCPFVSAVGWLWFFAHIYGTPNPAAPYGGVPQTSLANIARGAPGLLFDQEFGVLANAPVYLCALAGLFTMYSHGRRRLALELLAICTPYFVAVAAFHMWWGGSSTPARFLVPLVLVLVVPTAIWFATRKTAAARATGVAALLASMLITATLCVVDRGVLLFNTRSGASRLAAWLSPAVNLTTGLPSAFQNPPLTVISHAGLWMLVAAMTVLAAVTAERRRRSPTAALLAAGFAFAATAMLAVSLMWRGNHSLPITLESSGIRVLRAVDPDSRQIALASRPFRRLRSTELPPLITLTTTFGRIRRLPAGIYEVSGRRSAAARGQVRITTDSRSPPLEAWEVSSLEQSWARRLVLPMPVVELLLDADPAARRAIRAVSFKPLTVFGRSQRLRDDVEVGRATRYGRVQVHRVSAPTSFEPGGFWVLGGSAAEFAIVADPDTAVQLFIRNAPVENAVTLQAGSWRETLVLKPREERLVAFPLASDRPGTLLRIATSRAARPMDFEPKSDDDRLLGCWIEIR